MTQAHEFIDEAAFEDVLVTLLTQNGGWSKQVLYRPTETDLIDNWAEIIFENNNTPERLNNVPLSEVEKETLVQEIAGQTTPSAVHRLLQGKEVTLRRNNPADTRNHDQSIQLTIFDPAEVAGGDSTYQIAQQPLFDKQIDVESDRRGDLLLLIWGLPLIHIELKNSTQTVDKAIIQLQRYMDQQVFTGLMNAVQIMVAMTPDDMRYFARPVDADALNHDFVFHWTNEDNDYFPNWRGIVHTFLSIPQAHRLIGNYLIADSSDGVLKVLRPYQIYAVSAIIERIIEINAIDGEDWSRNTQKGGYIWHTTGSGKTMTSFKAAELLSRMKLAEKVVFVLDRIELSDQSLREYRNFASDPDELHEPYNTVQLVKFMKTPHKRLIVTSLHKLGLMCGEDTNYGEADFEAMRNQRILFVVDEAHRSTFGQMFTDIKHRFPHAVFIGFTGTPIKEINRRKDSMTLDLFGDELHSYAVTHGMRDGNVLEFDTIGVDTFNNLREQVALREAGAADVEEAMADEDKRAVFDEYMDERQVPMASQTDSSGDAITGIEELAGSSTWNNPDHRREVVDYIAEHWARYSRGGRLHAMLAANSILEAIDYYRLFSKLTDLRVTAVFTDESQHTDQSRERDHGLRQVLNDYNTRYAKSFSRDVVSDFKRDVSDRLAHKGSYKGIENRPAEQIDLVIVVDQLLTGYDSKWLNTLYFDRVFTYDRLVQAFSRTNRVLDNHLKPHGIIVYFRQVNTMAINIDDAFDLYSGSQLDGVFVDKLPQVLEKINTLSGSIHEVFSSAGISDYDRLPDDKESRKKFALAFGKLSRAIETASIQGFTWGQSHYEFPEIPDQPDVDVTITQTAYEALMARYGELGSENDGDDEDGDIPLDLSTLAVVNQTKRIDFEYLDAKFEKYRQALASSQVSVDEQQRLLDEVRTAYAALSQGDQEIARQIIEDIRDGTLSPRDDTSFQKYLRRYKVSAQNKNIDALHQATGIPTEKINELLEVSDGTPESLNEFSRLKHIQSLLNTTVFAHWLETEKDLVLAPFIQRFAATQLLRTFFLEYGIDPADWDASAFE